jgi:hypothetical protein
MMRLIPITVLEREKLCPVLVVRLIPVRFTIDENRERVFMMTLHCVLSVLMSSSGGCDRFPEARLSINLVDQR